jgi:twitching motility protein PilT
MKTLAQLLRELTRPDVVEFAVASDRLPCVKVGDKYEPVDGVARSTEAILEMLVAAGGSRYVEDLESRPAQWTARVEGVGSVGVHALMRAGRVQARFTLIRAVSPEVPHEGGRRSSPPARKSVRVKPPARPPSARPPRMPTNRPPARAVEVASDPLLRGAVVKPSAYGHRERQAATGGPASQDLDGILTMTREDVASDLHIVGGRPILLRVAGELSPRGMPIDERDVERMIVPIVPERLRATLAEQGSCDFAFDRPPHGRFRVNVSRQRTGLKACFRCIPPMLPTLASLGLPPEIERTMHHHQGLVLVTGPTGHGKTSTLAAIVDVLNRETTHHVITVEDPVEFLHPRKKAMISQREVGTHTRSFASALKASLREDPDVIVVGELRDTETVRMALAASETGHLVLGTMNTPSAAKTIDRLIDLFPPGDQQQVRTTLAGGLHLIVGQRLLPSSNGAGMVAAVEVLPGSVALWSLIRDAKTFQIPSLQQRGKGFGIIRLDESLADLVRNGQTTKAAALAVAESPEELEVQLGGDRGTAPAPERNTKDAAGLLAKAGQFFGKRGP